MTIRKNYTLCIFKNEILKEFHIWSTIQEFNKKTNKVPNVTLINAFSKSKYAILGKDCSQPAATTSFLRKVLSTNYDDWAPVKYIPIGNVNKSELKDLYNHQKEILEDDNYTCITRNPKSRFQSGRYAGKPSSYMKIVNMKREQIEQHSFNMLEDCNNPNLDIDNLNTKIWRWAVDTESEIHNISQLWKYVYENYSEFNDMNKRAA